MLKNPFFITLLLCLVVWLAMTFMGFGDDGGHAGDTHDSADHDHDGTVPNVLTIRNIMLFGVGFGASGYVSSYNGNDFQSSFVVGLVFGCATAYAGFKFFQFMRKQEGNTITHLSTLEGKLARVLTEIPDKGFGEVIGRNEYGSAVTLTARSETGVIPEGAEVRILSIAGNIATVTTALESAHS